MEKVYKNGVLRFHLEADNDKTDHQYYIFPVIGIAVIWREFEKQILIQGVFWTWFFEVGLGRDGFS